MSDMRKLDVELKEEFLESLRKTLTYFSSDLGKSYNFSLNMDDGMFLIIVNGQNSEDSGLFIERLILNKCFDKSEE